MDTNQKHTPTAWDMYRTTNRHCYIIIRVAGGKIDYNNWDDAVAAFETTIEAMQCHEYIGNVLALPELVDACIYAEDCLNPETDPRSSGMALHKLRTALRAAGLPDPQADHTAAARMLADDDWATKDGDK